ncbi:MAG: protein kinase [Phycisphaerales bacterium JB040]
MDQARTRSLFARAMKRPESEREAFVRQEAGADNELLDAVLELLRNAADDTQTIAGATGSIAPPQRAAPHPERIAGYRILGRLGEGGFGVVYEAEQREPVRRRVAIKVIKPGMGSDEVIARFEAERQALAVMDHPHVARVLDGGVTDRQLPYFVMELVEGEPITDFCDAQRLTIEARLRLMRQVCDAIQHAHSKGVIHRDIKPSNVLVVGTGTEPHAKVIDFGVAKAINQPLTEKTVFTEQGRLLGTPAYMSPEQASGRDVDTRSDIYSLGVLLYELLAGRPPFDPRELRERGLLEIQRIISEEDPPRPSTRVSTLIVSLGEEEAARIARARGAEIQRLPRRIKGELDWVVMKCLEKDRGRRYPTATELASELERFLDGHVVTARPPSGLYKARKFYQRHRAAVVATTLATVLVLASGVGAGIMAVREAAARRQAERSERAADAVATFLSRDLLAAPDPELDGPQIRVVELLDRASRTASDRFAGEPLVEARIRETLGRARLAVGQPLQAREELERARRLYVQATGEDDQRVASIDLALSESMWRRGDDQASLELLARLCERLRARPEIDEALRLRVRAELGNALKHAGRFDEARTEYQAALAGQTAELGAEHEDTLTTAYDLALLDVAQGIELGGDQGDARIEAGLEALRRNLLASRRALGPDHVHTITCAAEVATQLHRLGRLDEAAEAYAHSLDAMRAALGDGHWRTLQLIANIGRLHDDRDALTEAETHYREALAGYRLDPGPTSPDTVVITAWLADVLVRRGETREARGLLARARDELDQAGLHDEAAAIADTIPQPGPSTDDTDAPGG